jgi:fructose-1,6-bisphosphatase
LESMIKHFIKNMSKEDKQKMMQAYMESLSEEEKAETIQLIMNSFNEDDCKKMMTEAPSEMREKCKKMLTTCLQALEEIDRTSQ